ncbi:PREDICTED: transcriptional regulator ATRX homolog [Populus euphratica]|uniref:Transcriptional regulator ATRX homolog n=1 Tax=Populus euphratica TaxID=75702 RepID=A0AAJ6XM99_POPEU|nr:PREDICTED: transcriptional regulator ATRX homolog [Populus euphratica]
MATETAPSHQTPTSDHESIKNKVTEEVKPVEPETVSLAGKPEEDDLKPNELASQPTLLDKSEAVEDNEVEPPAVVVKKIDDVPAIIVPVDDKNELEKDSISDSHTPGVLALAADVVNAEPVAPAIHSVLKEAEEQQLSTFVEELLQEKPKMVDIPVSLHEAIEKTEEPSKVLPIKESEPIEAKDSEDSAVSKEVDKVESIIPEVEVKLQEQSEVGKQVEEPKTEAATKQQKEPLEVLPVKSEAIVVKDSEDSKLVSKEDDKTESEEQSEVIKVEPKEKSVEVIAEIQEPVEALPIKELEAVQVKDTDDSQELFKEADKVGTIVPELREVKLESEVTEHVEKTEEQSVEAIEETQDSLDVHPIKESEAVPLKDIDDPVAVPGVDKPEAVIPEVDKPEPVVTEVEVKQEEQSEVTQQMEKPESVVPETEVKLEEQSEVTKLDEKTEEQEVEVKPEGQSVIRKQVEQSEVAEQIEKPQSVIPETEVKLEEQSEVTKLDEKTEEHEVEVKPEGQSVIREQAEQSEVAEQIEKPESVIPETGVKLEEQSEVSKLDEKTEEHEVVVKPEGQSEVSEQVEIKSTDEKQGQVAAITQVAQAEIKEDGGKSSPPEIIQKAGPEAEGTDLVEASLKEIVVEAEKDREEREAGTIKAEGGKIASDTVKEEPAQPIKVEEVSNAASNAKITEKSFEGEKTVESVEPALENKKEEIPIDETHKDGNIEGKLDEATTAVSEPVKESQDSVSEAKEEGETAKTIEENSEQEKVDEIAKSDTQNLEYSVKDAEDAKESQDLPREVPAKSTQKHSNNILTRVKQSLVKAKKAIIGKSPTPKTVSSDSKGDVTVNN